MTAALRPGGAFPSARGNKHSLRDPRYSFLFTSYLFGHVQRHAITAVISGNRPKDTLVAQKYRLAFYDGRIQDTNDLHIGDDPQVTPLVSDNCLALFTWTGAGEFPAAERAKLLDIVARAHAARQKVRFWATPDAAGPRGALDGAGRRGRRLPQHRRPAGAGAVPPGQVDDLPLIGTNVTHEVPETRLSRPGGVRLRLLKCALQSLSVVARMVQSRADHVTQASRSVFYLG